MKSAKFITSLSFIFVLMFSLSSATLEEETGNVWLSDFDTAVATAEKEDKAILISFSGSDWCTNCMRLEKVLFESEVFRAYAAENLVLLKLDFPAKKKNQLPEAQQKHNDGLADVYNKGGKFPTVVLLNSQKDLLGEMAHPKNTAEEYLASIKAIVAK